MIGDFGGLFGVAALLTDERIIRHEAGFNNTAVLRHAPARTRNPSSNWPKSKLVDSDPKCFAHTGHYHLARYAGFGKLEL
jgi:hypothetical protein